MATTSMMPPPYKGQNDQYPAIAIQNPYCERMVNFNNLNGIAKLRQGNDLFAQSTKANQKLGSLVSYGDTSLFAMVASSALPGWMIYDITAGAFGVLPDDQETNNGTNPAAFYFNDNLIFCFGSASNTALYDGSAFTTDPYTFSTFSPYGGTEYKARAYFIGFDSTQFAYSGIEAISGATTQVDLGGQITSKAVIYMIRSISLTQNLTAESVLAFIFSSGEILVYGGSYPNAPDWARISRFKVSKPIEYNAYVEAKGDSFLFTQSEILSLRNLFISGYDKERDEGIGSTINKRWRQCMQAYIAQGTYYKYVEGVYDEKNDRIVISMPQYVNPTTGALVSGAAFQLIYDFNIGAWYEYIQTDSRILVAVGAAYFNDSIYIALQTNTAGIEMTVIEIEGGSNFVDDDLDGSGTRAIDYQLRTAPLPISKFGANQISGLELIIKSGLYPQTNYKWIADLGRQETAAQPLEDLGSGVTKPMVNVGIQDAITVQLDISGSSVSNSVGLELYAMNVWYSAGGEASR